MTVHLEIVTPDRRATAKLPEIASDFSVVHQRSISMPNVQLSHHAIVIQRRRRICAYARLHQCFFHLSLNKLLEQRTLKNNYLLVRIPESSPFVGSSKYLSKEQQWHINDKKITSSFARNSVFFSWKPEKIVVVMWTETVRSCFVEFRDYI